jgi:predicted nucleic acid-binding Zn ribbon protein
MADDDEDATESGAEAGSLEAAVPDPDAGRLGGRRDLPDERRPGGHPRLPMQRIGELIPAAARHLGLEDELRTARARTTWDALVGERVPAAAGENRLVGIDGNDLLVEADSSIVGQELRMRSAELLGAFRGSPGGFAASSLRIRVRHG